VVGSCGRGRVSDFGIRFVWNSGLLGPRACPMYGTAHSKVHPHGRRTITKFTGRTSSCPRRPPLGSTAWAASPAWLRLARRLISFIQLSKIRGAANGKLETSRGRKSPAQSVYRSPAEVSPQATYSGEARVSKSHYTGSKKGHSEFGDCFHGDTGCDSVFGGDIDAEKAASFRVSLPE
jgi:hypothetical protein